MGSIMGKDLPYLMGKQIEEQKKIPPDRPEPRPSGKTSVERRTIPPDKPVIMSPTIPEDKPAIERKRMPTGIKCSTIPDDRPKGR